MRLNEAERNKVYEKIFRFLIQYDSSGINIHPFSVEHACAILDTELTPLSQIIACTGMRDQDIFSLWGNEDGTVNAWCEKEQFHIRIAYNDHQKIERQRFTICEELSHIILGHIYDQTFNVFNQNYQDDIYAKYDCEARAGAGLLLCNPKFYYQNKNSLTLETLEGICSITPSCAKVRRDVFDRFQDEIINFPLYHSLPAPKVCHARIS